MRTPKEALTALEQGKPWPIYYLYGEEPFKIHEFIDKARVLLFGNGSAEFCVDRLDGQTSTGNDVLETVQSMGLFGGSNGKRLVVVSRAHALKDVDSLAARLIDAEKEKQSPWGDSVLILAADTLDGRRKFHQWLKKQGYALEMKAPRDAELAQWVQYLVKKQGAKVAPDAAIGLGLLSDGSLYRLKHEIEKAWLFAGGVADTMITAEHVAAIGSNQASPEMVELVKAVLEGKRARALLLAEKLITASEDALGMVGFLVWAIKAQGSPIAGRSGSRFPTLSTPQLDRLLGALIELDARLKGSSLDAKALVEQFVLEQTA